MVHFIRKRLFFIYLAFAEIFGFDDFNMFSPSVEMPIHFARATGVELDRERSVGVKNHLLGWVEDI
ncbi:MAG TPA: hypothetical protein DIC64_01110 [Alphaproteobacteria bacterium]|nr:hypothetical protein [Alphaproteobacteria bacterium]